MPKRTLYIKDEDVEVWDHLQEIVKRSEGKLSMSAIIAILVREYLLDDQREGTVGRIIIETYDNDQNVVKKAFVGKWLFKDELDVPDEDEDDEVNEGLWQYSAALTRKGNIVLCGCDGFGEISKFEVYGSVQEAVAHNNEFPEWVIQKVAKELFKEERMASDVVQLCI